MNLTPKINFIKTPESKVAADVLASPALHAAMTAALTEMTHGYSSLKPEENWHRLQGARDFIDVLLNICDPPPVRKNIVPRENLITT